MVEGGIAFPQEEKLGEAAAAAFFAGRKRLDVKRQAGSIVRAAKRGFDERAVIV